MTLTHENKPEKTMSKKQQFSIHGREFSHGPDLPELSPFAKVIHEIILEIDVERNTPGKVSFTSEELRERFIAKGYDPETGEKMK